MNNSKPGVGGKTDAVSRRRRDKGEDGSISLKSQKQYSKWLQRGGGKNPDGKHNTLTFTEEEREAIRGCNKAHPMAALIGASYLQVGPLWLSDLRLNCSQWRFSKVLKTFRDFSPYQHDSITQFLLASHSCRDLPGTAHFTDSLIGLRSAEEGGHVVI